MKKLLIGLVLLATAGISYAACNGPFCWDDTGGTIQSKVQLGGPLGILSQTSAQIVALTPGTTGQMYFCSDCTKRDMVCVSTGVFPNGWGHITSTNTACQ